MPIFNVKILKTKFEKPFAKFLTIKAQEYFQNACGKLHEKIQKLFKKCIDISIFSRYYRDSFWIKKLFKRSKQKFSQNNSTLYKEDRFSSQLPVFFLHLELSFRKKKAPGKENQQEI